MSADVWVKFFPSDWLGGTTKLSATEKGVYITLIMLIYDAGQPIARDDSRLARDCGIGRAGFTRILDALIQLGKIRVEDGRLANPRANILIQERKNRIDSAKTAANARHHGHRLIDGKKVEEKQRNGHATASIPHASRIDSAYAESMPRALAREPEPEPELDLEATPLVNGHAVDAPKSKKKRESDQALLDRIADLWNAWAIKHGSPQVQHLYGARAIACRRRVADLMEHGYKTPEEAFCFLLSKCDQSFFALGNPRSPLKFNQLMREGFMAEMIEGGYQHKVGKRWVG